MGGKQVGSIQPLYGVAELRMEHAAECSHGSGAGKRESYEKINFSNSLVGRISACPLNFP
jgi:hypothetical protein